MNDEVSGRGAVAEMESLSESWVWIRVFVVGGHGNDSLRGLEPEVVVPIASRKRRTRFVEYSLISCRC